MCNNLPNQENQTTPLNNLKENSCLGRKKINPSDSLHFIELIRSKLIIIWVYKLIFHISCEDVSVREKGLEGHDRLALVHTDSYISQNQIDKEKSCMSIASMQTLSKGLDTTVQVL